MIGEGGKRVEDEEGEGENLKRRNGKMMVRRRDMKQITKISLQQ